MLSRFVRAFLPRSKCLQTSWLQSLPTVIMEPQKIKFVPASTFPPPICHEWWDWMPWFGFFECWVLSQLFHHPLYPHQEALSFLFAFCHQSGVTYHLHLQWYIRCITCVSLHHISEVVDISPDNLDSSSWFIQPSISHDVLCIEVKQARWQYIVLSYSFPKFEPVSCSV